jgi:hypothetical protein
MKISHESTPMMNGQLSEFEILFLFKLIPSGRNFCMITDIRHKEMKIKITVKI